MRVFLNTNARRSIERNIVILYDIRETRLVKVFFFSISFSIYTMLYCEVSLSHSVSFSPFVLYHSLRAGVWSNFMYYKNMQYYVFENQFSKRSLWHTWKKELYWNLVHAFFRASRLSWWTANELLRMLLLFCRCRCFFFGDWVIIFKWFFIFLCQTACNFFSLSFRWCAQSFCGVKEEKKKFVEGQYFMTCEGHLSIF